MTKPKSYQAIMVSSTFADLETHRRRVIAAIQDLGYRPNVMEHQGPRADKDVLEDSLGLVRDSAAYIGVISHRYGQIPDCPERNPQRLSITELEFNEAMRMDRPILLFVMGEDHPVKRADVESDSEKSAKLTAFRKRAKQMREGSSVERIYNVFNTAEEFAAAATAAIGRLARDLVSPEVETEQMPDEEALALPLPPDLRAIPRYPAPNQFVGRAAELETLDDWATAADQHPMLLFEAIGGTGKSMVTWRWVTMHAANARNDWAGRFWYSFYEGGATMAQFCRDALAYMTGTPQENFRKKKIRELTPQLLAELEQRPWLMILDGLERILVAYHRLDAPQMRDEDAESGEDQIAKRDPCTAINPDDDDLLRAFATITNSKILVTSRLIPAALINRAGTPVPGVRREHLTGMRSADAEALFRACGATGNSKVIRDYLQRNCDCHPLVVGTLAGMVNDYPQDRGNFGAWVVDPDFGGKLDLANLDLTQRRNHILDAAIGALDPEAWKVLQTLALLQGGTDFESFKELNLHRPPPPDAMEEPTNPEATSVLWEIWGEARRAKEMAKFEEAKQAHAENLEATAAWRSDPIVCAAPQKLAETLRDLERRGLLQYEHGLKRYDLHPVVRGVATGRMGAQETRAVGERVVDHFSSRPHDPWEEAETLDALAPGIQIVATLTRMGEFERALYVYHVGIASALMFNLQDYAEMQRLLRPFFPDGWEGELETKISRDKSWLLNTAALVLSSTEPSTSQRLYARGLLLDLAERNIRNVISKLCNLSVLAASEGDLANNGRIGELAHALSDAADDKEWIFRSLLNLFQRSVILGDCDEADRLWARLEPMGRRWSRAIYRSGGAEHWRAKDLFWRGMLDNATLAKAERLAQEGKDRQTIRQLARLRGEWYLARNWADSAIASLNEALRLARASGLEDPEAEALSALARLSTGELKDVRETAERLHVAGSHEAALAVAELWQGLGERDRAVEAALRAFHGAIGNGEPYVYRYHLDRARALLNTLGETPPEVPQYDPSTATIFPWEEEVKKLIEKTRKERDERKSEAAKKERKSKKKPGKKS